MKLYELKERTRKIILWTTVIALGIVLLAWWGKGLSEKIGEIQKEGIGIELPEIDTPVDFPEILNINVESPNENKETIVEQNGKSQE